MLALGLLKSGMWPATTPTLSAARRKENKDKGWGDGTSRGPKRRDGRVEERQGTREQRTEVKGEGDGGGERGTRRTRCPERKERAMQGSQWRREDGSVEEMRRPGSRSGAFKSVLKPGNLKSRGRRFCQENRKTEEEEA